MEENNKESLVGVSTLLPLLPDKTSYHTENVSDRNKIEADRQEEVRCHPNLGELLTKDGLGLSYRDFLLNN